MIERYDSIIVDITCRIMVPFIQLFGMYVIFHGHYSPGGGFQGGVLLASSMILHRLSLGYKESYLKLPPARASVLGTGGMFLFILTALTPIFFGGVFLDYGFLPIPGLEPAELRYYGILIAEIWIGIAVFGCLVVIFDRLTERRLD
ncbi:MAG: MnhB domain-containing protein [Dehalococcoidales bacterium]|nr:MnhB domain-containing protein [Dehalococcoidales bacterium]MDD5605046.1 MnhB domain-containing protein [Dehalococcoidales bacterium]